MSLGRIASILAELDPPRPTGRKSISVCAALDAIVFRLPSFLNNWKALPLPHLPEHSQHQPRLEQGGWWFVQMCDLYKRAHGFLVMG